MAPIILQEIYIHFTFTQTDTQTDRHTAGSKYVIPERGKKRKEMSVTTRNSELRVKIKLTERSPSFG